MDTIADIFSLNYTLIVCFGYPLSLLELFGTSSGLACVYLASRNHILTWPVGIFNSICFFFLFFQIQLYSDMLLQIYFFGSSIYGWWIWRKKSGQFLKIHSMGWRKNAILLFIILVSTYLLGKFTLYLPGLLPNIFKMPPSFPYWDAFTTTASIVANFLLARRILESWFLWVAVDVICISLYFLKDIPFVTAEYIIFLIIAFYGCYHWLNEYKRSKLFVIE